MNLVRVGHMVILIEERLKKYRPQNSALGHTSIDNPST